MKSRISLFASFCMVIFLMLCSCMQASASPGFDNAFNVNNELGKGMNEGLARDYSMRRQELDQSMSGEQNQLGNGMGSSSPQNMRQKEVPMQAKIQTSHKNVSDNVLGKNTYDATQIGQDAGASTWVTDHNRPEINPMVKNLSTSEAAMLSVGAKAVDFMGGTAYYMHDGATTAAGSDYLDSAKSGGSVFDFSPYENDESRGGGAGTGSGSNNSAGVPGCETMCAAETAKDATACAMGNSQKADPQGNQGSAKQNSGQCQGSRGGSAGEDAKECMHSCFETMRKHLINVANENAGQRCFSRQPSKSYANVIWMVQQMYKQCYIPMAVLFLLPGALITNTKTLVAFGILGTKDDDVVSPFTGIMRSIIAIFLIPATQLATSYIIDVSNALEDAASQYVSLPLIYLWAEEQIQVFSPDQQGGLIKNLPVVPQAPYLGKFAGMPVAGATLEQLGGMFDALTELANECLHMLTIGLNVISAFQIVMICYLFCMGPISAAFFAWPSVGRDLFRKAFSTWLDGTVVLSLWKFWFNVVLLCMTVRLESGNVNPFDIWEVYYLIAFLSIMMVVPFNPFDFRPGEIVTHVLGKAEGVAAKVAQGGKGGGSKGGGKGGGGACGGGSGQQGAGAMSGAG